MSPKISIIIPSYNEEKNISRCLDSILNQTFSDFEVLCVDDGSNDNTFDIIKEYSKKENQSSAYFFQPSYPHPSLLLVL